jgi:hypothetical protein
MTNEHTRSSVPPTPIIPLAAEGDLMQVVAADSGPLAANESMERDEDRMDDQESRTLTVGRSLDVTHGSQDEYVFTPEHPTAWCMTTDDSLLQPIPPPARGPKNLADL